MDKGTWQATVHGGLKESDTTEQLSTAQQSNNYSWYSLNVASTIQQALLSRLIFGSLIL